MRRGKEAQEPQEPEEVIDRRFDGWRHVGVCHHSATAAFECLAR